MKKIIPILLLLFLVGCDSRGTATSERVVQNITPNIIDCGGNNSLNDCYGYIVDKNTGVVYLYYSGYFYIICKVPVCRTIIIPYKQSDKTH